MFRKYIKNLYSNLRLFFSNLEYILFNIKKLFSIHIAIIISYLLLVFSIFVSFVDEQNRFSIFNWDVKFFQLEVIVSSLVIAMITIILIIIELLIKNFFKILKITPHDLLLKNKIYNIFWIIGVIYIICSIIVFFTIESH